MRSGPRTATAIDGRFRGRARDLRLWLEGRAPDRPALYHPVRVCGLFGAMRVFATMSGAVMLVHGSATCSYFQKFQISVSFGHKVFAPTTGVGEHEIVYGGEELLADCLREVDRRHKPELIAVLNTCAPVIVGDDVAGVTAEVRPELKARHVVVIDADGLQYHHQGYGYNNALSELVNQVMIDDGIRVPASVNLFGEVIGGDAALAQDKFILRRLLAELGVVVNVGLPGGCGVADVERAPRGELNIPRCAPMADAAALLMKQRFGTPYLSVPMPYGLTNTDRWVQAVASHFGREQTARQIRAAAHSRLHPMVAATRSAFAGKRAAIHGGPGRVIANIAVARELGMKVSMVSLFFATELTCQHLLEEVAATGDDPELFIDCSLEEVRTATRELGIEVWFGNSLDFPQTYEKTGMPAFETLIYNVPYQGYEGYANALRHFQQRGRLAYAGRGCGQQGKNCRQGEGAGHGC